MNTTPNYPYCCQNAVQRLIDHMIPVPDHFDINPVCLHASGLCENEFINGFKTLNDVIRLIYEDMIVCPGEYGLPLVEDIQYPQFNPKANESKNACKRLSLILYHVAKAGMPDGGGLKVSTKEFQTLNKSLKSKDKLSNIPMILNKLNNFGFIYDGVNGKKINPDYFMVSYPDNPHVLKALKGYMESAYMSWGRHAFHYSLAIDPAKYPNDQIVKDFLMTLTPSDRLFLDRLHDQFMKYGLHFFHSKSYGFGLVYFSDADRSRKKDDEGYLVRCFSEDKQLEIVLRLRHISEYAEYIVALPPHIKAMFTTSTCHRCNDVCRCRMEWEIEGQTYAACVYSYFRIKDASAEDAEYYAGLVRLEREVCSKSAKPAKK